VSRTSRCLLEIFLFVRPQQNHIALECGVAGGRRQLSTPASAASRNFSLRRLSSCVRSFSTLVAVRKMRRGEGDTDAEGVCVCQTGYCWTNCAIYQALRVGSVEPLATASL